MYSNLVFVTASDRTSNTSRNRFPWLNLAFVTPLRLLRHLEEIGCPRMCARGYRNSRNFRAFSGGAA